MTKLHDRLAEHDVFADNAQSQSLDSAVEVINKKFSKELSSVIESETCETERNLLLAAGHTTQESATVSRIPQGSA